MSMSREQLWNNSEEPKEVATACSQTDDTSIFGPVHFGNSSRTLLNINSVLRFFDPCVLWVELNATLRCDCNLAYVIVYKQLLNRAHWWSEWVNLFSNGVRHHRNDRNITSLECDDNAFFSIPLESSNLSVCLIELDKGVLESIWDESEKLWLTDDTADNLIIFGLHWTPSDIAWLSFDDECLKWCVTLMIWNSQHLVDGSRHEVALSTPVTMSNFLTMLRDARNLSLRLSIEKDQRTFFCTNDEDWMCFRPRNITSIVLLGGKFNILEFSLTHRPDRDHMGWCKNSERVIILIPSEIIDSRSLVTWEFKNSFTLSIKY